MLGRRVADAEFTLRRHRLAHFPALRVRRSFFGGRFAGGCAVARCDASCCRYGVYADLGERDRILEHAAMIIRHMEPHQERDPAKWFEAEIYDDGDFPSGRTIGTVACGYGCVFLDSAGKCTLQKAAASEGMHPLALKPFYCTAYPVVIEEGVLMIDDSQHVNRPQCCRATPGAEKDVLDVCAEELEYILGPDGFAELRALASSIEADPVSK